nr:zinc finger, CCHC-type [Tanacetum cinerariifolium]
IGSGVGTGSMQVLHGFDFEVEPLGDHTFETLSEAAFAIVVVEKIYAHESPTFNNTVACEVISKWKAIMKDDMDAWLDVYVLSNNDMVFSCGCKAEIWATKGLLDKAKENVLGMEVVKNQSGYTLRVSQSSLEYQMVCTRPDIASTDVGILDGFNRGLQTYVQFLWILTTPWHMEALSTTEAGYMTFTEAWKKKMWLKGLLMESRYELRLVAGIATGALVKGDSRSEVPAQVEIAAYRY